MEFATSLSTGKTYEAFKVSYSQAHTLRLVCPVCKEKVFKLVRRIPQETHMFAHHKGGSPDCELYFPATTDQRVPDLGPGVSRGQTFNQFISDIDNDLQTLLVNAGLIAPTVDARFLGLLNVLVNKEAEHLAPSFAAVELSNLALVSGEKNQETEIASVIFEFYTRDGARFIDGLFCKWFLYAVYFKHEDAEMGAVLSKLVNQKGTAFTSLAGLMLFGLAQFYAKGDLTGFCNDFSLKLMTYSSRLPLCDESLGFAAWTDCLGTLTRPNGINVGNWKGVKRNGQGTPQWPDGQNYWPDGQQYVGAFKDGKYSGQGTQTWPDGREYVGAFKDGKYSGQGTFTSQDGEKYVGDWKDGLYDGQGTQTFSDGRQYFDGEQYVGAFKDGKRNGRGTLTWPSGAKYVGAWKNGEQHGKGTWTSPDGEKYVGDWRYGLYDGQGIHMFADGRQYAGAFEDGKRNGQGTLTWPSGAKYVGRFRHDKYSGQGTLTLSNGNVSHSGEWVDGEPKGLSV